MYRPDEQPVADNSAAQMIHAQNPSPVLLLEDGWQPDGILQTTEARRTRADKNRGEEIANAEI